MKDIPGFEGRYAAQADGIIVNIKTGRMRKAGRNSQGYEIVTLRKNGESKTRTWFVHNLVALAYGIEGEVIHLNNIKHDNRVVNLASAITEEA